MIPFSSLDHLKKPSLLLMEAQVYAERNLGDSSHTIANKECSFFETKKKNTPSKRENHIEMLLRWTVPPPESILSSEVESVCEMEIRMM